MKKCLCLLLFFLTTPACHRSATNPAPLNSREADVEKMRRLFAGELARHGGNYESWMGELAPLHRRWKQRMMDLHTLNIATFVSPDGFQLIDSHVKSLLADLSLRPDGNQPLLALLELNRQLKERNIDFMFAMVPTTPEVFPEKTVEAADRNLLPHDGIVAPYARKFLNLLAYNGVEVLDLATELRLADGVDRDQLTLKNDFHWSGLGAMLSARAFARRLMRYDFVRQAQPAARRYSLTDTTLHALGGNIRISKVITPEGRLFEPDDSSPILVIGDSNMLIYSAEDPSISFEPVGGAHAGFTAHLARYTGIAPTQIALAALTAQMLNREPPSRWQGRKVVIMVSDLRVLAYSGWGQAVKLQ